MLIPKGFSKAHSGSLQFEVLEIKQPFSPKMNPEFHVTTQKGAAEESLQHI